MMINFSILLLFTGIIIIIAIIGIFRWKRAMEPPVKAIKRQGRKKWAEMNRTRNEREIFNLTNEPFDLSFSLDPSGSGEDD